MLKRGSLAGHCAVGAGVAVANMLSMASPVSIVRYSVSAGWNCSTQFSRIPMCVGVCAY